MALLASSREFVFLFYCFCLPCLVPFVSRPRIETSQSKLIQLDPFPQYLEPDQGSLGRSNVLTEPSFVAIKVVRVTSMLVTDVGDQMCW